MENNGTNNHPSDCDVTVQLSDCGREDAQTVFATLDHVFSGGESSAPGPKTGHGAEPTVWMATFDSSARSGDDLPGPPRLASPVQALLTGDQHAVSEVEKALGQLFDVRSSESVAGEHEKEARLLLASR
ncbi:hypothetical protein ACLGI4_02285 [Streptomyces sp. HMX112]|uniref:hypothetical protein n=1 Tax=Streptomyces sp. HMX112 TaxID=3390850 RepID=UPI003A801BA3